MLTQEENDTIVRLVNSSDIYPLKVIERTVLLDGRCPKVYCSTCLGSTCASIQPNVRVAYAKKILDNISEVILLN